jgi:hypothetical protein
MMMYGDRATTTTTTSAREDGGGRGGREDGERGDALQDDHRREDDADETLLKIHRVRALESASSSQLMSHHRHRTPRLRLRMPLDET